MGPSWFRIQWYRHLRHHRIWVRQWGMRWLRQWVCSSWCRWVFRYRGFFCRYHRWLRYQAWQRHQCVLRVSELKELSCMVQQLQWRPMVRDKRWNRVWISFRNQLKVFLIRVILILIQFLLRLSGRLRILRDQCSYQLIFWFCLSKDQRFLFQWCSDLWRSCWQHLLFQKSIIQGGIIICRFQFWLHQWRWVPSPKRQLLGRVFQHRFHWRKCWRHHHHLQLSCQMAFNHQAEFRVQGRRVPSRHYRLRYLLIRHELKWLLSFFFRFFR